MSLPDDANTTIVSRLKCADCGGWESKVLYADSHMFCYRCPPEYGFKGYEEGRRPTMECETAVKVPSAATPFTKEHMPEGLKRRRLTLDTLTRFQYFVDAEGNHVSPLYDQSGKMAHQKRRNKDKDFWLVPVSPGPPKPHECQLFGQPVWGDKFDRMVVITEGEIDAMTVAQETGFKFAVVSVPAGTGSALKAIQSNYRWLDRFDEVIFWCDNDEPGQALVEPLCAMFPGKSKTIKVEGFKDASDMKQANKGGDIYGAVYGAVAFQPEGIINAALTGDDMLGSDGEVIVAYPWPETQRRTLGIRESEVCYHVAGTGIGKTSQLVELQWALLRDNIKFGIMRFEDTRRKTQLDLMSVEAGRRLHLDPLPQAELVALHAKVFGGGTVELFDPEKAKWDFESILGYLRYMVFALGCKVVFIDPLSFIVAGAAEKDERKALDNVAFEFAQFVKKTKANLQIAHHLKRPQDGKPHEEGREITISDLKGSGGIAHFSMTIMGYERNQQGERPDLTRIRVLKNRFAGWTGVTDILQWDGVLGRQLVTDEKWPDEDGDAGKTSFGPVRKDDY